MSPHAISCVAGDEAFQALRTLRFAMLGCEPNPPYGPNEHTAQLLLKSLVAAAQTAAPNSRWHVSIDVYNVQSDEYPEDYGAYDGILLPGSFSSAYDDDEWIQTLKSVIQEEIVKPERPTLAICFGHQILAHSFFPAGCAVKTPTGPRAGKKTMTLTSLGSNLLQKENVSLYYTHGDMVERLPPIAVSLGGCENVPIQSAAYFGTRDAGEMELAKPFAISIQAHPEYACDGLAALEACMNAMEKHGAIDSNVRNDALKNAHECFPLVEDNSLLFLVSAGRALGWFPSE